MIYSFDAYELDTRRYELRRGDERIPVEPQVFDVLTHLVRHRDRVVDKRELLDEVWGTRFVTESALTSRIKAARRAVGDDGTAQRLIQTVHGRGYRFVGDVVEHDSEAGAGVPGRGKGDAADGAIVADGAIAADGAVQQEIRFCRAPDGTRLAYALVGDGPPLVKAANWLSHLSYSWQSPVWRHWFRELSARHTLVHYDERGSGMSDWDVDDVSFESWVTDLETVVEAAGLERFPLLGVSQGGPVAISYAVRHPERVSHLVLYGTFARGRQTRARTPAAVDEARVMQDLMRVGWGSDESSFRQVFAAQFMPDGTIDQWEAFDELERMSATADNASRLMDVSATIDVMELAPRVTVPTLLLHADQDRRAPLEEGRLLADLIPGSRLVTLESRNHILMEDEPAWKQFLAEVEHFLSTGRS